MHFRNYGLPKRGQINSKKSRLRRSFDKQHGKRAQALFKSVSQHLNHIHWLLRNQLSRKTSPLLTCQILGLLVNIMSPDEKYPVLSRDKLTIPIQTQLSKTKTFSRFFAAFLKFRLYFEYFERKYACLKFCVSQITASENVVGKMSKKPRFRGTVDRKHGKHAKALLKSAWQHLYQIRWSLPSQLSWKKSLFFTCQILKLIADTLAADERYPVLIG